MPDSAQFVVELLLIDICAHGPSRRRSILTVWAHVDRSLNPYGTPNLCRKQLGTVLNAFRYVYDPKISKNYENLAISTKIGTLKKFGYAQRKSLKIYMWPRLDTGNRSRVSNLGAWAPLFTHLKKYKVTLERGIF